MGKVILIESNIKLESIYSLNLRVYLGLDPIAKKAAEFALNLLVPGADVDLVITRANVGTETTALNLYKQIKKNKLLTPMIVIGDVKEEKGLQEYAIVMPVGVDLKTLIKNCAKATKTTSKGMMEKKVPNYFPIPAQYFFSLCSAACDIFCLELNDDNTSQFKKVLVTGEGFTPEKIKEFISSGVAEFYVEKDLRLKFVNQVTNEMIAGLSNKDLEEGDKVLAGQISMEVISGKIGEVGITQETVSLAKNTMKNIVSYAKESNELKSLLKNLVSNKTSYLFKHTQILTYVVLHIVKHVDWGTEEHEEKLAFVAFFHDILLGKDEMALIKSDRELKSSNLTAQEKEVVHWHAHKTADLLKNFPKAPAAVEQVLRQHHGTINGVGFTESYNLNISPLAIAFIIAEEYTDKIIESGEEKLNKTIIMGYLRSKFPTSRFRKIIDVLEKITF